MKKMKIRLKRWQECLLAVLPLLAFSSCDKGNQPGGDFQQSETFTAIAGAEIGKNTRATLNPDNLTQFNWLPKEENGGESETFTVFKEGNPFTFTMDEGTLSEDRTTAQFKAESGFGAANGTWLLATLPAGTWTAASGNYSYSLSEGVPVQTGNASTGHIGAYMPMYAAGQAENSRVELHFHHLFSLLKFEILNRNTTVATFTGLTMETVGSPVKAFGHRVTLSGAMADEMPAAYPTDDAGTSVSLTMENCQAASGEVLTAYIPTLCGEAFEGNCSLKFSLTVDGRTCSDTPLSDFSNLDLKGGKWAPGKIYTFRLLLDDEIHLESVTVSDWTDGGIISDGTAEETQP